MDTQTLLRKITALPVIAAGLAEDLLAGDFRSIFKGQGIEFDEARHYQAGDDVRSIDWNASARFGTPYVKMYREERELTIMILLDISASMHRGSFIPGGTGGADDEDLSPYEQGLIAAALIAFSAERTGQRVGAFFFDSDVVRVFPPKKGRRHVMSIICGALQYQNFRTDTRKNREHGSNITKALAAAGRLLKRRSLVALISDFYSSNWEQQMGNLNRKHDVIALRISDPAEKDLTDMGLITIEDPETNIRIEAPTGLDSFKEEWTRWHLERSGFWDGQCRRCASAHLELSTASDAVSALLKFFGSRRIREHS
ncbi:MAG: DUF58 domain-containing protein [Treponema sp.]|nr:DUF58 domain-containing protein [Treponema sp.]